MICSGSLALFLFQSMKALTMMYKSGFEHLKLGYASAISYMLLMIIISVSSMLLLFFKRELK